MVFKDSGDDFHQFRTALVVDLRRIHVLESFLKLPEALLELL